MMTNEKVWIFQDKSKYPEGEWNSEPDKIQWVDEYSNLDCLILRNSFGALCGYVGVTRDHPLFRKDEDDIDVSVHGGVTFTDVCSASEGDEHICHVPFQGRDPDVWWIGFDCAHNSDFIPGMSSVFYERNSYKNVRYVKNEVKSLASQLKEIYANSKSMSDNERVEST